MSRLVNPKAYQVLPRLSRKLDTYPATPSALHSQNSSLELNRSLMIPEDVLDFLFFNEKY